MPAPQEPDFVSRSNQIQAQMAQASLPYLAAQGQAMGTFGDKAMQAGLQIHDASLRQHASDREDIKTVLGQRNQERAFGLQERGQDIALRGQDINIRGQDISRQSHAERMQMDKLQAQLDREQFEHRVQMFAKESTMRDMALTLESRAMALKEEQWAHTLKQLDYEEQLKQMKITQAAAETQEVGTIVVDGKARIYQGNDEEGNPMFREVDEMSPEGQKALSKRAARYRTSPGGAQGREALRFKAVSMAQKALETDEGRIFSDPNMLGYREPKTPQEKQARDRYIQRRNQVNAFLDQMMGIGPQQTDYERFSGAILEELRMSREAREAQGGK